MNRYLKNQKGIVWIPIIIWSIVISGSIFIAQDAVNRGYITIDSPNILKQTPSPQPTISLTPLPVYQPTSTPIPTKSPSQGQVQRLIQNNQNTQTTQGRSGRIVKYKEYCKGGVEISVYESEFITKKAVDGKTYSLTKDDWDCYERNLKQGQQIGSGNTSSDSGCNLTFIQCEGIPVSGCSQSEAQQSCNRVKNNLKSSKDTYNNCVAEKQTKLDACKVPSNQKYEEDKSICLWAWGVGGSLGGDNGNYDKLTECYNEVHEEWKKSQDDCYKTFNQQADTCLSN